MKNGKRFLSILPALVVMATLAAGCGTQANTPAATTTADAGSAQTTQATEPAQKEKVTLQFSWWGNEGRHTATMEAVNLWNASNPDIQVETSFQGYDGYSDKLVTQFAGQTAPDVFQLEVTNVQDYALKNQIMDLTPYMESDFAGIDKSLKSYFVVDGKNYAVALGINGSLFSYNKTKLDALGVALPTDNETLDSLLEKCKLATKDTNGDGKTDTWGIEDPITFGIGDYVRDWAIQYGIDIYTEDLKGTNFDNPKLVEFYKMLGKFNEAGVCPQPGEVTVKEGGNSFITGATAFHPGTLSSFASGANSMTDEIGGIALPVIAGAKESRATVAGLPAAIYSQTKHPEEARQFLSWFVTSPESAKVLNMSRGIYPSEAQRSAATEAADKYSKEVLRIADFYNSLNVEKAIAASPVNLEEWDKIYQDTVAEYQYKKINIEQMCKKIKELGDPILAQ